MPLSGGKTCAAGAPGQVSCTNNSYSPGISMHIFPKNEKVRAQWVKFVKDKDTSITDLQQHLTSIRNWCFNNSLLINPDKAKLIVFGTKQMLSRLDDFKLSLLGKELTPCDPQLSYDEHISKTLSSCASRLCQINRVKHVFDQKTLKLVINALVFSRLFYCSSVWSNTAKKNVNKLQLVQNFAARIVVNKRKYDHVTPILK